MPKIAAILGDSIVDGPGLRVTVFAQGCPHRCPGCHNPETWNSDGGTEMTTEQVLAEIEHKALDKSVTFSGGEPFYQAADFADLAERLKADGYEVACFSGYTFEELLSGSPAQRKLLNSLDVLIDGRFEKSSRTLALPFRGSANQRILDVPRSLAAGKAVETTSERWNGKWGIE